MTPREANEAKRLACRRCEAQAGQALPRTDLVACETQAGQALPCWFGERVKIRQDVFCQKCEKIAGMPLCRVGQFACEGQALQKLPCVSAISAIQDAETVLRMAAGLALTNLPGCQEDICPDCGGSGDWIGPPLKSGTQKGSCASCESTGYWSGRNGVPYPPIVRDLRGCKGDVPELEEAALWANLPFIRCEGKKVTLSCASPEVVQAFMKVWAPSQKLTEIKGDPAKGFASGMKLQ